MNTTAYLTLAEAVEVVPVAQITLRRAIKAGDLTASKVGGKLLIHPDNLTAWVDSHRVKAAPMPKPASVNAGTLLDQALQRREAA